MFKKKSRTITPKIKLWLVLPVFLLTLYAAYCSFLWAFADVLSVQVRYAIGKAQTVGQTMDVGEWRRSRKMLEKTLQLRPHYADYLDMGKLFFQVASVQKQELLEQLQWPDARETALNYARRAVMARPSWPYFWNELILLKAALGQFDDEMTGALERAMSLGRWEEPVLYDIANTGLEHWDEMSIEARRWIILAIDKTLIVLSAEQAVVKGVRTHANIDKVCQSIGDYPGQKVKALQYLCNHLTTS